MSSYNYLLKIRTFKIKQFAITKKVSAFKAIIKKTFKTNCINRFEGLTVTHCTKNELFLKGFL